MGTGPDRPSAVSARPVRQAARRSPSSLRRSSTISPRSPAAPPGWVCCATCGWPTSRSPVGHLPPPSGHGHSSPLHASALGKVLLAFAPAAVARSLVATGLPRFTPRTLTRADQLLHALSVTRLTRIATCDGELVAGETTVAAPVVGPGGQVVAALETIVPDLHGVDSVRQLLTVSARSMSRELAGPGLTGAVAAS
jgi:hypothetical protein